MKRILFILIIQSIPLLAFGQNSDSVSTITYLEKYGNRCIDSLESIEYLDNHILSQEFNFCNIATCISFLEMSLEDSLLNEALYERLRQIARVFYNEGTPVLIVGSGYNSGEVAETLNRKKNPYNITYISIGSFCMSIGYEDIGVKEFNKETKLLVNFQVPETKKQKRRNKKRQ